MKNFACVCGNTLYFENTVCVACERVLGYLPDIASLSALNPTDDGRWRALHADAQDKIYRQCSNYQHEHVCNWMVEADDKRAFCVSCRLNDVIPNLDAPNHRSYWYNIEAAKRDLGYRPEVSISAGLTRILHQSVWGPDMGGNPHRAGHD